MVLLPPPAARLYWVAIYTRVGTDEQDVARQLDERREHIVKQFPLTDDIGVSANILPSAAEDGGKQYREICANCDNRLTRKWSVCAKYSLPYTDRTS